MNTAQKHFEKTAQEYTAFRESGLLGILVAQEKKTFLTLLPSVQNKDVLDLGCGSGIYTTLLQEQGAHVVALDFSLGMAAMTKQKEPNTLVASLETAAFKKQFDVVLCWGPLEFVHDQKKALQNIASLLKPDGILLILYPKRSFFGLLYSLYHSLCHSVTLTILSRQNLHALLRSTSFIIEKHVSVHVLTYALRCKKLS